MCILKNSCLDATHTFRRHFVHQLALFARKRHFGSHLGFLSYTFKLKILKNPYFDVLQASVGVFMGAVVAFLDVEAILAAILDFSKCSRMRGSHPPWNVQLDPTQQ